MEHLWFWIMCGLGAVVAILFMLLAFWPRDEDNENKHPFDPF